MNEEFQGENTDFPTEEEISEALERPTLKLVSEEMEPSPWYQPQRHDPRVWENLIKVIVVDKKTDEEKEVMQRSGANIKRILCFDRRWSNRLGYDEARRTNVIREEIPWEECCRWSWEKLDQAYLGRPWRAVLDTDSTEICEFLSMHYNFVVKPAEVRPWLDSVCNNFRFHSIRDWLNSLIWDGTPRIHDWLIRLCNAPETELNLAYCPRILQMAVARAFNPGCKVDTMPVLYGEQGMGKSEVWKYLAGRLDDIRLHVLYKERIGSDNGTRVLHSGWIIDLDECASLKRCKDPDVPKQWLSSSEDTIVQKYKNDAERWPRSSIFVASSNPDDLIKARAGARRFWTIEVGVIDLESIEAEREQLWAEAKYRYDCWVNADKEEKRLLHWSLPPALWEAQAESVESVITELPFEGKVSDFLEANKVQARFSTNEIISRCVRYTGSMSSGLEQTGDTNAVAAVMYKLGWKKDWVYGGGGKVRGWKRPGSP